MKKGMLSLSINVWTEKYGWFPTFRKVYRWIIGDKTMMKALMLVVLMAGIASAEPMNIIDMEHPLLNARIGMSWDSSGKQHSTAYVPFIYVVGKTSKREYATLNFGAIDKMNGGKVGYAVSVGARIDTIFQKFGESAFAQKWLMFAVLPPIQISPCFVTQDFKKFTPMLTVATKFGK